MEGDRRGGPGNPKENWWETDYFIFNRTNLESSLCEFDHSRFKAGKKDVRRRCATPQDAEHASFPCKLKSLIPRRQPFQFLHSKNKSC